MVVAMVVYFGLQYGSNVQGLLVDPKNALIGSTAGDVRVNNPTALSEGTQRKIERQATGVKNQLQQFTESQKLTVTGQNVQQRTDQRLARRQQLQAFTVARAMATEYSVNSTTIVDQRARLAQRNAYAEQQRTGVSAQAATSVSAATVHAAATETPSVASASTQELHEGARVQSLPNQLSNSGVATNVLFALSLCAATAYILRDPSRRARLIGALLR